MRRASSSELESRIRERRLGWWAVTEQTRQRIAAVASLMIDFMIGGLVIALVGGGG